MFFLKRTNILKVKKLSGKKPKMTGIKNSMNGQKKILI